MNNDCSALKYGAYTKRLVWQVALVMVASAAATRLSRNPSDHQGMAAQRLLCMTRWPAADDPITLYAACQKCFAGPMLYGFARSQVLHSELRENVGSMFSLISCDNPPEAYIS